MRRQRSRSTLPPPVGLSAFVLVALCLFARPALAAPPAQAFGVGPPASWVKPLPLPSRAESPANAEEAAGLLEVLVDQQVRVVEKSQQRYVHRARKVLSSGGVDDASDIRIQFDPSYEKLTLHGVWRIRDGQRQDVLRPTDVKVLQQEDELESRLYNGMLSVVPLLHDVRVGDTVEYAFSIDGANPVFAGHFAAAVDVGFGVPLVHWRYRLLWPEPRPLFIRTHGMNETNHSESLSGGVRELIWERDDVPAVAREDRVPDGYPMYPWIQLSELETWGEVARWASSLFTVPTRSKELEQEVQRFAKEPTAEARFLAALRFVQDDVRYLGIELGPNSHQPYAPHEVLSRRFGDCKDKSLLLVTLLQGLGIEARPALVNTSVRQRLDDWQPTPHAFDHAIVRARVDGRELWVDPTHSLERGDLASHQPVEFARALVVDPSTTGLVEIPSPTLDTPSTVLEETYLARERYGPAELTITTTRTGRDADRLRQVLATTSVAELSRSRLNSYAKRHEKLRLGAPMTVEEDAKRDVLITREHYVIDDFWTLEGHHDVGAALISAQLWEPSITQRTLPLKVAHPVHVRHRITVEAPHKLNDRAEHPYIEGPAFRIDFDVEVRGPKLILDYQYRSLAGEVEPARLQEHLNATRRSEEQLGYEVSLDGYVRPTRQRPTSFVSGWAEGVGLAVLTLMGFSLYLFQRSPAALWSDFRLWLRRKRFSRRFAPSLGDTAQSAIPVDGPEELLSTLGKLRCRCGATGRDTGAPLRHEAVVLGDQHLTLVQWRCPDCAKDRRAYFEDRTSRAA